MALMKLNPTRCTECGRMNKSKTVVMTKRTRRFRITCDSCGKKYTFDLSGTQRSQEKSTR